MEKTCFILEMQKQQHRNKRAADDSAEQAERNKNEEWFYRSAGHIKFVFHTGKVFSEER